MEPLRFNGRYKLLANGQPITEPRQHQKAIAAARQKIEQQDGGFAQVHTTPSDVFVTTGYDTTAFVQKYGSSMAYLSQFTYPAFEKTFTQDLDVWSRSMVWRAYEGTPEFQTDLHEQLARQQHFFFKEATPVEVVETSLGRRILGLLRLP